MQCSSNLHVIFITPHSPGLLRLLFSFNTDVFESIQDPNHSSLLPYACKSLDFVATFAVSDPGVIEVGSGAMEFALCGLSRQVSL